MKLYLTGILALILFSSTPTLFAQTQIDLPITFQDSTIDYTLTDFGDALTIVDRDPNDTTNTVAITTKTVGAATWAGTTMSTPNGLATPIPFTENDTKISVLVYAPAAGIPVRLKAEDHTNNTLTAETEVNTTAAGWQKLVFDFSMVAPGTNPFNLSTNFDMLSIFFDFGSEGNGAIYYWDEVNFGEGTPGSDVTLSDILVSDVSIPGFNPEILNYEIELDSGTVDSPTISAFTTDTAATYEVFLPESLPGKATIVVLGSDGFTRSTYSIEFKLPAVAFPELSLPINFEDGPYDFIDFDGGTASVIVNPHSNELNSSATVARIIKSDGAPWAGSKLILHEKLDFTNNNSFSMKVFSPRADIPILFKLESESGAEPDNIVNTTKANEWETIVWNYPDAASGEYDQIVFMFDFGTVGDGSDDFTFLFDDIIHFNDPGALSKIDLPVTFQNETTSYEMTDFGGNVTELGADPTNSNNTVGITTKTQDSETWAGTTIGTELGFANAIPFHANETRMNVRVYSPTIGIPVRLKAEDHGDPTLTAETEAITTKANEWETLVFDFSNVASGTNPFNLNTNFDKLSIFFDFNTKGNGDVYYWDNVAFSNVELTSSEEDIDFTIPNKTEIIGSYPNPFNPSTNILFNVEKAQNVEITVYTTLGRKVETIFSGNKPAGQHSTTWNATSSATGVYFIRMTSATKMSTIKVLLIK
ncbi:MAG: T9SS type A sorting domain-containing protein [Balneolaceae bacterium]